MDNYEYIQLLKEDIAHCSTALGLYIDYQQELDQHANSTTPTSEIAEQFTKRLNIQGSRADMHFELCCVQGQPVGFAFYAIDRGGIRGLLEAGYGYIMEFYVAPEFRRRGIGRSIFTHVQEVLQSDGAATLYLTPDSITGIPFWCAMGFRDSGLIDPDNHLPIYTKQIAKAP